MSDFDSDQDIFTADEGPVKASTMTAAKKAIIKSIADEFGNKELAELPFLHGIEPLSGGRLNLRRVFLDQYKQLAAEKDEEEKEKRQGAKTNNAKSIPSNAQGSMNSLLFVSISGPTRRQREEPEKEEASTANNNKKNTTTTTTTTTTAKKKQLENENKNEEQNGVVAAPQLPLTLLELFPSNSYGPSIILSEKRQDLVRWRTTTTTNKNEFQVKKTTRICSCCARLARYRCPVCAPKMTSASHVGGGGGEGSTLFSDPDGGLVCSEACLELHSATRCGKHVQ